MDLNCIREAADNTAAAEQALHAVGLILERMETR